MEFEDRVSAYPNRYVLTTQDGSAYYVILERADEPIVPGTPLNAETFNSMFNSITPDSIGASPSDHTHDTLYYTKTQVDSKGYAFSRGSIKAYLPPTIEDVNACNELAKNLQYNAKFDVDGDGMLTNADLALMKNAYLGTIDLSTLNNMAKSTVTVKTSVSDPNSVVSIEGTTVWGSNFKATLGLSTILKLAELESRIAALEANQ